jgi:preprotein translocase subunit Sec63
MDPFLILGVSGNATQDEIKQAYRRLAMRWHPDRNPHSSEAKERFHQAAAATSQSLHHKAAFIEAVQSNLNASKSSIFFLY